MIAQTPFTDTRNEVMETIIAAEKRGISTLEIYGVITSIEAQLRAQIAYGLARHASQIEAQQLNRSV